MQDDTILDTIVTNRVLNEEGRCHPQQKDSHPLPKTPPNTPAILYGVGGVGLVCRPSSRTPTLLGAAIKGMEDEENTNKGKKEVEMESEEMGGLTSLSVGIVCQKPYEEPDERLSAALFLLGSAINDANDDQDDLVSTPNKMEIEVDLEEEGRDVDIISNDSNKCQCIPLSIVDPPKTPNPIRKCLMTSNKFGRGTTNQQVQLV